MRCLWCEIQALTYTGTRQPWTRADLNCRLHGVPGRVVDVAVGMCPARHSGIELGNGLYDRTSIRFIKIVGGVILNRAGNGVCHIYVR